MFHDFQGMLNFFLRDVEFIEKSTAAHIENVQERIRFTWVDGKKLEPEQFINIMKIALRSPLSKSIHPLFLIWHGSSSNVILDFF